MTHISVIAMQQLIKDVGFSVLSLLVGYVCSEFRCVGCESCKISSHLSRNPVVFSTSPPSSPSLPGFLLVHNHNDSMSFSTHCVPY